MTFPLFECEIERPGRTKCKRQNVTAEAALIVIARSPRGTRKQKVGFSLPRE